MNKNLKISTGKYFPRAFVYFGYIGILFGVISFFEAWFVGIGIILISALVSFNIGTLEIDTVNKKVRNYPFFFGLKLGNWSSITEYTEIAVLRKNISETTFGGRTSNSVTTSEVFFDICILNDSHFKKLTIKRFTDKEKANQELNDFATQLGLKVAKYNPVTSQRTKRRR